MTNPIENLPFIQPELGQVPRDVVSFTKKTVREWLAKALDKTEGAGDAPSPGIAAMRAGEALHLLGKAEGALTAMGLMPAADFFKASTVLESAIAMGRFEKLREFTPIMNLWIMLDD